MEVKALNHELGNIDIYLLDQILKGRYTKDMRILDAGCGEGRNLQWFLNNNYQVYGIDASDYAILMLQFIVKSNFPHYPHENFLVSTIENSPFPDLFFDVVICNAVLHFSEDEDHFFEMFASLMRQLRPGGQIFIRTATDIGIDHARELKPGVYQLKDGQVRFLLSSKILDLITEQLEWIEPVKSVVVNKTHSMGVLIGRKPHD